MNPVFTAALEVHSFYDQLEQKIASAAKPFTTVSPIERSDTKPHSGLWSNLVRTKKFRYSMASPQGLFPLTPALSLGERENPRPAVGKASVAGTFESRELLFPLPQGEGQGEGKAAVRPCRGNDSFLSQY